MAIWDCRKHHICQNEPNKNMTLRIVRMHFTEASAKEFFEIFNQHKSAIRHFPGCLHLELLKDPNHSATFTTLSQWNNPESLEGYRKSELFAAIWAKVKPLFAERSQAFSLEKFIEVD